MKSILLSLARYHRWANDRLGKIILTLPAGSCDRQAASSFPSLLATLLHMGDAETVWWNRFHPSAPLPLLSPGFSGGCLEALTRLEEQNNRWIEFLEPLTDADLQKVLAYTNLRQQAFAEPISEILLHLFNHGTYHRGQLVSILHQLGATGLPSTDYISWVRNPS